MASVRSAAAVQNVTNGALGLVATLVDLADAAAGDCRCEYPADCVRCQARRGLAAIRERAGS